MVINREIKFNDATLLYTAFERKSDVPYITTSGVEVTGVVLAPLVYSYRTSVKQDNFMFKITAGIWSSLQHLEDYIKGISGRNMPIDTYDMEFTLRGQSINVVGSDINVTILTLQDALRWFKPSVLHIGGFEITEQGYGIGGILTLPDPNTGMLLSNYWN